MSLPNATEQTLDAIVEKHGAKWSEDYRRRFAAMVEEVKQYPGARMKIIKPGKLPERDVFRGHCFNCKAQIECERKEGTMYYDQRDGHHLNVKCPTLGCNEIIHAYPVKS